MMRSIFLVISALALSLAACSENHRDLLAPPPADLATLPGGIIKPYPYPRPDPFANWFVEISAGWNHTCARMKAGNMYCWGVNAFSEIGIPSTGKCGVYGYGIYPCVPQPTRVTGSGTVNGVATDLTGASTLRAGGAHTCAISGGTPWCWGWNFSGQVGIGTSGDSVARPTPVSTSLAFTSIEPGGLATCGITTNALLYCWGQLFQSGPSSTTPALYSWTGGWSGQLGLGSANACGILQGNAVCWGDNQFGQLGADPVVWPVFPGPLGAPGTNTVLQADAGSGFVCGDQLDGTVACTGQNDFGQLGNGRFSGKFSSTAQVVGASIGLQLHGVTVGWRHACALDANGAAWCWGDSSEGKLGGGSLPAGAAVGDPTPVVGGHTFSALAAGQNHTCGIGTDNHIYCWGENYKGQLGLPGAPLHGQSTPVQALDP